MTEAQLRAYEAEIAALQDCESLAVIGRVERCEIGNFPVIASPDKSPVAYVADEQNARFFAGAPKLVGELCAEIRRLQTDLARFVNPWTIQIQSTDGHWSEFCHDAPITLENAEKREAELKAEHPQARFRVVPWLNNSQHGHLRVSLDHLRNLKPGWDSYSGAPITEKALTAAGAIVNTPGQVVPCSNGGVQIEWHCGGVDVEICITPEGTIADEANK